MIRKQGTNVISLGTILSYINRKFHIRNAGKTQSKRFQNMKKLPERKRNLLKNKT